MSSLKSDEKSYFEKILDMSSGYVLSYNDSTFGELFHHHGIDIHSQKYQNFGTSKAKKMRAFWQHDSDELVGKVMSEMLDSYKAFCEINNENINKPILKKSRNIVARLSGNPVPASETDCMDNFLKYKFTFNTENLPIEGQVLLIINNRLAEAEKALNAGAFLSVIFLCGSVLEGVLLGVAQKEPSRFNKASASPKDRDNNVKQFQNWNLSQLIDVACEIGLLKPDIKKFSHGLREFRNYIHPYEQMQSHFSPDEHTAKVCFQVLKAALANIAGER